jgi:hypothetical protein
MFATSPDDHVLLGCIISRRLAECLRQEVTTIGRGLGQSSKRQVEPSGTCCQVGLWGKRAVVTQVLEYIDTFIPAANAVHRQGIAPKGGALLASRRR